MDHPYQRPNVALALGGGSGLRGLCHLGVLEVLASERIPVSMLVGAGAGGVIAAGYSFDADVAALRARVSGYLLSDAFGSSPLFQYFAAEKRRRLSFFETVVSVVRRFVRLGSLGSTRALVGDEPLRELVEAIVPAGEIATTAVLLRLVALDLKSGREVVLSEGEVRVAALASASLASLFPPVALGELLLVDNGFLRAVPVSTARAQAEPGDLVFAVDVSDTPPTRGTYDSALDVVMRVHHAYGRLLNDQHLECADIALRPDLEDDMRERCFDEAMIEDLVEAGRRSARAVLPALRRRLLSGVERILVDLVLRHGFLDERALDACVHAALESKELSLAEMLYKRQVVSPQVLGAMIELVHRNLVSGRIASRARTGAPMRDQRP